MSFRLADELFVVPYEGTYLIYAPLCGSVIRGSSSLIKVLQAFQQENISIPDSIQSELLRAGILVEDTVREPNPTPLREGAPFAPTSVTLFPTFDCNLRCVYCYSQGGERKQVMSRKIAEVAIEKIVANAISAHVQLISLGFHGGGEPFFGSAWDLMRHAVEFARERAKENGLHIEIGSATNGVLSQPQLQWMIDSLDRVSLSLDGPPEIQNAQRPLRSGEGSSMLVERTIAFMEEHKFPYGIRCTITRESLERMPEIVRYFRNVSSCRKIHLEPLYECGRCATSQVKAPGHPEFGRRFIELLDHDVVRGIQIAYSGAGIDNPTNRFCGACGENFVVTPLGDVTSCYEVSHPSDARSATFFIGKFNSIDNLFKIDENRVATLKNRTVQQLPHCTNCIAKFSCAGDCPAKSALIGNLLDTSTNTRCSTNQLVTIRKLARKIRLSS